MLRALFFREFRKCWLVHAGLLGAYFGCLALLKSGSYRDVLSILLIEFEIARVGVILVFGLISGERSFSSSFKETRFPFLVALPKSRKGIWTAVVGGRLLGAIAAVPLIVAIPPWTSRVLWDVPLILISFAVYFVFFFGGTAFALGFRRELAAYLAGFPVLVILLVALSFNALYGFAFVKLGPSELVSLTLYQVELKPDESFSPLYQIHVLYTFLALAVLLAAVSLRAFCRGELHLLQRQARTLGEIALAVGGFFFAALVAFSSSALAPLGTSWQPSIPDSPGFLYTSDARPVSADGRFLVVSEQIRELPIFNRLAVVNLRNGSRSRWMEHPEILQASWSRAGSVLNVLTGNSSPLQCLGLSCSGSTEWYRLAPDLRLLSRHRFEGRGRFHRLESSLLLVVQDGDRGKAYRLDEQDGSFEEILDGPLTENYQVFLTEHGALLSSKDPGAYSSPQDLRAWTLDADGRVVREFRVQQNSPGPIYFLGSQSASAQEIAAKLERCIPDGPASPQWVTVLPPDGGPVVLDSILFLTDWPLESTLWSCNTRQGLRTRIFSDLRAGDAMALTSTSIKVGTDSLTDSSLLAQQPPEVPAHTLVRVVDGQLFAYDHGRSLQAPAECAAGEQPGSVGLEPVQGVEGPLVRFTCHKNLPGSSDLLRVHHYLRFHPGSGELRPFPWPSAQIPTQQFHRWLYFRDDSPALWVSDSGEVWQMAPGEKSFQLSPAALPAL